MNKYYTKLKSIPKEKYENYKLMGTQYVCAGSMSTYSYVDIDNTIVIPEEFTKAFSLTHSAISGKIVPHRDQGVKCKILIYLSDNNAITRFYTSVHPEDLKKEANCGGCTIEKFSKGQCDCVTQTNNLKLVDQFEAHPNDVYLINTDEIHSVEEISSDNPRYSLSFCTNNSYEDTYNMLKHYGLF